MGAEMEWYFERGTGQEGPVGADALRAMLAEGTLKAENKVWRKGLPDWLPAGDVEELSASETPPETPPEAPAEVPTPAPAPAQASPAEPQALEVATPAASAPVYVPPAADHSPSTGAGEDLGTPAGVCTNPVDAFKRVVIENYANFSGRAPRSEYWWFFLAFYLGFILALVHELLMILWVFGLLIPMFAVQVRRLHDIGKSGTYLLVSLIPLVSLVLLFWYVQDSEEGSNDYGPNPKG